MGDPIGRTSKTLNRPAAGASRKTAGNDKHLSATPAKAPAAGGTPRGLLELRNVQQLKRLETRWTILKSPDEMLHDRVLDFFGNHRALRNGFEIMLYRLEKDSFSEAREEVVLNLPPYIKETLPKRENIRKNDPDDVTTARDRAEEAFGRVSKEFDEKLVNWTAPKKERLRKYAVDAAYYYIADELRKREKIIAGLERQGEKSVSVDDERLGPPLPTPQEIERFYMDVAQFLHCRNKDRL